MTPAADAAFQEGGPRRVAIVGGGPGGLYLAMLLKKADPAACVEVIERNAPDASPYRAGFAQFPASPGCPEQTDWAADREWEA